MFSETQMQSGTVGTAGSKELDAVLPGNAASFVKVSGCDAVMLFTPRRETGMPAVVEQFYVLDVKDRRKIR